MGQRKLGDKPFIDMQNELTFEVRRILSWLWRVFCRLKEVMVIYDLEGIEAFIFDIDGTILVEDSLLPYVKETIQLLKSMNKKVFYLTNSTIRTKQEATAQLTDLSLPVELSEVITAASLSARYFHTYAEKSRVMVIGGNAVESELRTSGIEVTNYPREATHVLVGLDKQFTYEKLHLATKAVRMGAELVGINPDPFCPMKDDVIPDTGALLKAIEVASNKKVSAIIGKPSNFSSELILSQANVASEQCLIIGDRLDTDILFGKNVGMKTALVLSGVTSENEAKHSSIKADFIFPSLKYLASRLSSENIMYSQ